jgi:hypothetical protein
LFGHKREKKKMRAQMTICNVAKTTMASAEVWPGSIHVAVEKRYSKPSLYCPSSWELALRFSRPN